MHTINRLLLATSTLFAVSGASAAVIINEVDYDQPGSDTSEFIELFNTSSNSISLDQHLLELINGTNNSSYRSIELSGFSLAAGDYLVICGDSSLVLNCDLELGTSSWLQNGAPDGVALYSSNVLVDSMSYEGQLTGFTEGSSISIADSNSDIMSLSRIPNGTDSDDNFIDFQSGCITPGSANIAGTGDCSSVSINPVPVPGAVWLFASGLLGLAGIARRADTSA